MTHPDPLIVTFAPSIPPINVPLSDICEIKRILLRLHQYQLFESPIWVYRPLEGTTLTNDEVVGCAQYARRYGARFAFVKDGACYQ